MHGRLVDGDERDVVGEGHRDRGRRRIHSLPAHELELAEVLGRGERDDGVAVVDALELAACVATVVAIGSGNLDLGGDAVCGGGDLDALDELAARRVVVAHAHGRAVEVDLRPGRVALGADEQIGVNGGARIDEDLRRGLADERADERGRCGRWNG